jgi:hypothetical protein
MTPSGWHDATNDRDAGHDDMQLAVYEWAKTRHDEKRIELGEHGFFELSSVEVEYPFHARNTIAAFADVCEVWRSVEANYHRFYQFYFVAFELKPRIRSVGGLIRQCVALSHHIENHHQPNQKSPLCVIIPVVPHEDPKLPTLRKLYDYPIIPWSIEEGRPYE